MMMLRQAQPILPSDSLVSRNARKLGTTFERRVSSLVILVTVCINHVYVYMYIHI